VPWQTIGVTSGSALVSTPSFLSALQQLKPVQGFMPTTFLERGVAVPFTTPLLAGARARPGGRNHLELIVPNPTGGAGVYILPWDDVAALCRPTVHDRQLSKAVASLRTVTPAMTRRVAREVAVVGLAGRGAAAAARSAELGRGSGATDREFRPDAGTGAPD
jgi:hypothetical protein